MACNQTAFIYAGPHLDVFALWELTRAESDIIFIEPLVYWRNRARVETAQRSMVNGQFRTQEENVRFNHLFECEASEADGSKSDPLTTSEPTARRARRQLSTVPRSPCAPRLSDADVDSYAEEILRRLRRAATMSCNATVSPLGTAPAGLQNLRLLGGPNRYRKISMTAAAAAGAKSYPAIVINFESDGVARRLRVLVTDAQDVDYASALTMRRGSCRHPVSSFVHTGLSKFNSQLVANQLCTGGGDGAHGPSVGLVSQELRVIANRHNPEAVPCKRMRAARPLARVTHSTVQFACAASDRPSCRGFASCDDAMRLTYWAARQGHGHSSAPLANAGGVRAFAGRNRAKPKAVQTEDEDNDAVDAS